MHNNKFFCPQWFFFFTIFVLIVLNIFLKIEQNVTSHIVKFTSGGFACKLPSLEINLDKLFCSGGQRRRTITVGLHFLPQGNFQNNSQVKPRLSCLGCCLFVRKLSFSTFITVDA